VLQQRRRVLRAASHLLLHMPKSSGQHSHARTDAAPGSFCAASNLQVARATHRQAWRSLLRLQQLLAVRRRAMEGRLRGPQHTRWSMWSLLYKRARRRAATGQTPRPCPCIPCDRQIIRSPGVWGAAHSRHHWGTAKEAPYCKRLSLMPHSGLTSSVRRRLSDPNAPSTWLEPARSKRPSSSPLAFRLDISASAAIVRSLELLAG